MATADRESMRVGGHSGVIHTPFLTNAQRQAPKPWMVELNSSHFVRSQGLPWWLSGEESTCQCRRCGFNPCVRKIPGEGNGNLLQHSCLGNPMDRGA